MRKEGNNQNQSKQIFATVLAIAILIVMVIGISFAAFTYTKSGEKQNTISTGTITMVYTENEKGIHFDDMRYSVGVGFTWITMIGPLSLSYAFPLNDKDGDETKNIQFEIGRTF